MFHDHGRDRRWRVVAAALGLLIALGWWEGAQAEGRPPVPQPRPTVEAQPEGRANDNQEPAPKPTWPTDFEAAEKASRAECSDAEECRSDQRDYSDLQAQWRAANAAKGQEAFSRYQTWIAAGATGIAFVGTIFLIWTFKETKRTADAAADANRQNREAFVADQRPWIAIRAIVRGNLITFEDAIMGNAEIVLSNIGKTPAKNVRVTCKTIPFHAATIEKEINLTMKDNHRS